MKSSQYSYYIYFKLLWTLYIGFFWNLYLISYYNLVMDKLKLLMFSNLIDSRLQNGLREQFSLLTLGYERFDSLPIKQMFMLILTLLFGRLCMYIRGPRDVWHVYTVRPLEALDDGFYYSIKIYFIIIKFKLYKNVFVNCTITSACFVDAASKNQS